MSKTSIKTDKYSELLEDYHTLADKHQELVIYLEKLQESLEARGIEFDAFQSSSDIIL